MSSPVTKIAFAEMAEANGQTGTQNKNIRDEIYVKIFQNLNYRSLNIARRTCKKWKTLIDVEDLIQKCWKRLCK